MTYISNILNVFLTWLLALFGMQESTMMPYIILIKVIIAVLFIMLGVAYLTWLERKIHGLIHIRKGPNVVGPFGLLQPIADGVKLILKEIIIPSNANKIIFILAPVVTFVVAMLSWAVIPLEEGMVFSNINVGVLYILSISSLGVYGIIMAGWASKSQYSYFGAIRSSAQMISYELSMSMLILSVVIFVNSLNLTNIVLYQQVNGFFIIKLFPLAIMFFITMLAETNRHPFDLPEADADIVGGYHTEYSGFPFALFFLGEYANMMLSSAFFTILFLGGWLPIINIEILGFIPGFIWFLIKMFIVLSIMIQLRSVLPRYRYDQLMKLGWVYLLPLSTIAFVFIAVYLRFVGIGA